MQRLAGSGEMPVQRTLYLAFDHAFHHLQRQAEPYTHLDVMMVDLDIAAHTGAMKLQPVAVLWSFLGI